MRNRSHTEKLSNLPQTTAQTNNDTQLTKSQDSKGQRSKGGVFVSNLLIVAGSLLLVGALVIGGYLAFGYLDAQNRYRNLSSDAGLNLLKEKGKISTSLTLEDIKVDWDKLHTKNPDVVGWIIIPGTKINYPVVQGTNNEFYLYHLFDGTSNSSGAIFADSHGSATLDGKCNYIYGHNMLDGSMFSDLLLYKSSDFLNKHQTIFLATPVRNFELSAVATLRFLGTGALQKYTFEDDEEYVAYRDDLFGYAIYEANDLNRMRSRIESLYLFATCDDPDSSYRIIVTAVPVRSIEA
ncbi:MAG: class B sortase [Coriobacteriia bacterium]|nr:class B sortase [Coriobacteriia bacterium]